MSPDEFRRLMSAVHVGQTIKITRAGRHPMADELLTRHLDVSSKHIVDIGCSDGTTSVDLLRELPDSFGSFTMADLYLHIEARRSGSHLVFHAPDGSAILTSGRRLVAWPGLSRLVRALYSPVVRRASAAAPVPVLLLNPDARALIEADPRVSAQVHDVFRPWPGPHRPDVVKVANLLRRLYFSDDRIAEALRVIAADLPSDGHFLVVDNGRDGLPARAGLYRRAGSGFEAVADAGMPPEIHDLVMATVAP